MSEKWYPGKYLKEIFRQELTDELTELDKRILNAALSQKPYTTILTKQGFVSYTLSDKKCFVDLLYVFHKYRKKGIGRALMEALEEEMRNKGVREIVGEPITVGGEEVAKELGYKWEDDKLIKRLV